MCRSCLWRWRHSVRDRRKPSHHHLYPRLIVVNSFGSSASGERVLVKHGPKKIVRPFFLSFLLVFFLPSFFLFHRPFLGSDGAFDTDEGWCSPWPIINLGAVENLCQEITTRREKKRGWQLFGRDRNVGEIRFLSVREWMLGNFFFLPFNLLRKLP